MRPGLRRRLTLLVTLASFVTLGALTAVFNLALRSSLDNDASQLVQARAQAAAEAITVKGGRIRLREGADEPAPDAQVWVYAGGRLLEHPETATAGEDEAATRLAAAGGGQLEDDAADVRLGAVPLQADSGARAGVLVAAVSIEPYERTAKRALLASIGFAAGITLLIGLATWLVVGRALRPVARMTADVENWSEHDLDRRFSVGEPSDELTHLAYTFDGLLDRVSALLRHEKLFSAEISHELRTPVAAIAVEAELALRREREAPAYREALAQISRRTAELTEILESLLIAARQETTPTEHLADLAAAVGSAAASLRPTASTCGVTIETRLPGAPIQARFEPAAMRRLLAPLLENACAYARARIVVSVEAAGGAATIRIADDGPGLDPGERAEVFSPGGRGSAARNPAAPDGTGLGLPLAQRLARSMGGEIAVLDSEAGAVFEVRLPLRG